MKTIIVSDTTSLIVLEKLDALGLLCKLFDQVLVPAVVLEEVRAGSPQASHLFQQFTCLQIVDVPASKRLTSLLLFLDVGEANAIELAATRQLPLIIDERKGRQIAQQFGIHVTGFAGLLIQCCRSRILSVDVALDLLDQAVANGLRLSGSLHQQVRETLNNLK